MSMLIFIFISCATPKKQVHTREGNIEQARMNVILDFVEKYKTPRRYLKEREEKPFNVFHFVREEQLNHNTLLLSILPEIDKISMLLEDKLGEIPRNYFPNRYIIEEGKLFLWNDGVTPLQSDVIETMHKYEVLDSIDVKMQLGLLPDSFEDTRIITIDDRLESYNYFVCNKDFSRFKRVVTYKAFGYYKLPKLNCSGNASNALFR